MRSKASEINSVRDCDPDRWSPHPVILLLRLILSSIRVVSHPWSISCWWNILNSSSMNNWRVGTNRNLRSGLNFGWSCRSERRGLSSWLIHDFFLSWRILRSMLLSTWSVLTRSSLSRNLGSVSRWMECLCYLRFRNLLRSSLLDKLLLNLSWLVVWIVSWVIRAILIHKWYGLMKLRILWSHLTMLIDINWLNIARTDTSPKDNLSLAWSRPSTHVLAWMLAELWLVVTRNWASRSVWRMLWLMLGHWIDIRTVVVHVLNPVNLFHINSLNLNRLYLNNTWMVFQWLVLLWNVLMGWIMVSILRVVRNRRSCLSAGLWIDRIFRLNEFILRSLIQRCMVDRIENLLFLRSFCIQIRNRRDIFIHLSVARL